MSYIDRQFTLTEDRWTIFGTIYGNDTCSFPLAAFRVSGPYTLGAGSADAEGATEGNFYYETNEWVAYNADFAGVLNGAGCGAGGWVPYEPQSVIETGCLTAHPASECPDGELDLVKLAGGELYFGERSVDLCATRAPRAGAYGLKKLPATLDVGVDNFYPEGVALDRYLPAYVGSVGTGTVYRHDGAAAAPLYGTPYGLGGATVGMKVAGEHLWTCVANTMTYATGVAKISLATGEAVAQYPFPAPGFCNDLAVDAQGAVYATESTQGIIYKLAPGAAEWTSWLSGYPAAPAVGFGFNGVAVSPDGASLLIGRLDSGELLEVPFNADGSAGTPAVSVPGGAPTAAGFDGLTTWRGQVYAVRDGAVVRLVKGAAGWESSVLVPAGRLEFPTTIAVDNHGNLWVVEGKLGQLFDMDDATNAAPPFKIHRFSPRTESPRME
jgi:sugar lactone lactonase YvrE